MRLGKTSTSRTRGKERVAVTAAERQALAREAEDGEFMEYLLGKGYSSSTVKGYLREAGLFRRWAEGEDLPVEATRYADVLGYIQRKRGKVKQRTLSAMVNSLKHYFRFMVITDRMEENPAEPVVIKGVGRRRLYEVLSRAQLDRLYANYGTPEKAGEEEGEGKEREKNRLSELTTHRNRVIVGLLVFQGLNITELVRLEVGDVKLREGRLHIASTRKSNGREMPLEAVQMLEIMEYVLKIRPELLKITHKQSDKLLVSTGTGEKMHNALQRLSGQLREMGVSSYKQIRTSVIVHWLKVHNLRQAQYLAGHRFVSSTEGYLINDLEDLKEDIGKYHPIG